MWEQQTRYSTGFRREPTSIFFLPPNMFCGHFESVGVRRYAYVYVNSLDGTDMWRKVHSMVRSLFPPSLKSLGSRKTRWTLCGSRISQSLFDLPVLHEMPGNTEDNLGKVDNLIWISEIWLTGVFPVKWGYHHWWSSWPPPGFNARYLRCI